MENTILYILVIILFIYEIIIIIIRWMKRGNFLCTLGLHSYGNSVSGGIFRMLTCEKCGHSVIE